MGIRLVYGLKTDDASFLDEFYPSRRLREAAMALGLDYDACIHGASASSYEQTLHFCRGNVALLRGELPIKLYERLEADGIHVENGSKATSLAADKLAAASHFAALGLRHPSTIEIKASSEVPMALPFVVKPRFGKMGRGVALIETPSQWAAFIASDVFNNTSYIAQAYVASSHGRDVRFFFAHFSLKQNSNKDNTQTYVVVLRHGDGLASNAHAGGNMESFNPPQTLVAEAERIFAASGLCYGSVDFLFTDELGDSFAVCETNACPGFETLEQMSGLDVAGAILLSALGQEKTL